MAGPKHRALAALLAPKAGARHAAAALYNSQTDLHIFVTVLLLQAVSNTASLPGTRHSTEIQGPAVLGVLVPASPAVLQQGVCNRGQTACLIT